MMVKELEEVVVRFSGDSATVIPILDERRIRGHEQLRKLALGRNLIYGSGEIYGTILWHEVRWCFRKRTLDG